MALLFAAEIGDLEQVKSLVLSCEDRFGALAAGQPAVSARKNAAGGGAAARNNTTSAPTSSPASSSTSAAGAAGAAPPAASSPKRNNKAEDVAAAGPTPAAPPGTPKAPNSSKTTAKTFEEAKLELVNGKDSKRGRTALIAAVGRGHFAVADFLLNVGADASAQDRDGVDVLMLASFLHGKRHSHTELVQLLLKHGADVSLVDRRAQSSLHYAAKRGCLGAVKLLLAQMAGEKMHLANRKDHKGRTALMIAAGRGHVNLVRSFCAHGVDVNLVDAHGWSALHHAARAGREEMVEVLLGNGANVATRDAHALTSLQIASALGHVSFVAELLYRNAILDPWQPPTGASWPEDPNVNHRSAILLAATNGHMVTLHVLLAHRLATALAEVASTTAASHSREESRPPREERPVAKNAKEPPQPQEKESAPENSSATFTSSTPPFASSPGAPSSSLHENTKFSDAEEAPMDAYTSLEAEIKEARRLAALSCHVDVVRFLGFCAGLQLPQDALKIRFRAFCICSTCDAYYFKGGNQDNNSIRPTETAAPAAVSVRAGAVRSPSLASAPLEIAEINQACEAVGAVDSSALTAGAPGAPGATAAGESMVATSAQQLANGMPGKIALPVSEPPPPQAGSHPGDMSNRNRSRSSSIATRDLIDIRSAVELVAESTSQRSARATTLSVAGSYRPHEREDGRGPRHAGLRKLERSFDPDQVFDPEDPRVKSDILRMIGMYLQEEGLMATTLTLQDEAQIKLQKRNEMNERAQHIKHLISIGDWPKIREIHVKPLLKRNRRRFLYALYRQEYLELVARGENERAFSFLSKRLKPLEAQGKYAVNSNEFRDLCYLLTCKSVHDAAAFRDWDVASARDKLAEEFESMIITQANSDEAALVSRQAYVAKDRLVNMLQQAVAYQLEFSSNTGPNVTPKIETLLEDFERVAVPQTLTNTFVGHTHNVKCVKFLGREGRLIASGSSDCTIMLWRVRDEAFDGSDAEEEDDEDDDLLDEDFAEETATGADANGGVNGHSLRHYRQRGPELVIRGHKSRIWDIASDNSGRFLVSASGDNTVRMWDVWACMEDNGLGAPEEAYLGKSSHYNGSTWTSPSDAWGSPLRGRGRSRSRHYQTTSEPLGRLHDQSASDHCLRTGHEGDIYTVAFQNDQEHIATAGYDKTVRLVNVRTNQLVRTFQGHRAAVSQVCFNPLGNLIVSVSKDSGIKFWDTISGVCVRTFNQPVGEVTSIDISRDGLQLLASSKDSSVRLWDVRMEKSIRKFRGYQNSSLNFVRSVFGPRESLVFSGSEDAKVHVWDTETGSLLAKLRGHNGPVFHAAWNSSQDTLATCSEDGTYKITVAPAYNLALCCF
ncbi:WD repeat-containing protein wdr-5.1 [Hondaea fermentalgiana]|uniref:WD40 repeat-containing protein SMU1 n=1 Tax=Hondaea fermentalgiana TaxID=2315210 RepID=A0A2R5GTV7_9STRA|nr:WD repeat-containing protein wdr-5.1 [Hondaea fermentalgiana]|eukprot:GBG34306.1 WD repeat-containing protein wdr-5.1 [Hondaea fermentalgiana]